MVDIPREFWFKNSSEILMGKFKVHFKQLVSAIEVEDFVSQLGVVCQDPSDLSTILFSLIEYATLEEKSIIILSQEFNVKTVLNPPPEEVGEFRQTPLFIMFTPTMKIQTCEVV